MIGRNREGAGTRLYQLAAEMNRNAFTGRVFILQFQRESCPDSEQSIREAKLSAFQVKREWAGSNRKKGQSC